jgi:hypothetical protein
MKMIDEFCEAVPNSSIRSIASHIAFNTKKMKKAVNLLLIKNYSFYLLSKEYILTG